MIEPTICLFSGASTPILPVIYRTQRAITVWLLAGCDGESQYVDVTQEQVAAVMNTHAVPLSVSDNANGLDGKLIPGEYIAPRLAGKFFIAKNRTCLDQDVGLSVAEWSDCAHFAFPMLGGRMVSPENRYIATKNLKNTLSRLLLLNLEAAAVNVHVPFAAYNMDQCSVHIACNPELGAVANFQLPETIYPLQDMGQAAAQAQPSLSFSGPSYITQDAFADVQLSVTSYAGAVQDDVTARVYVEVISGYANKTRVDITGQTTLRVSALGLLPGDVVHLKAGFKNFSGVAEIQIPVV